MVRPISTLVALPSFRDGATPENEDSGAYTVPLWCTMHLLGGATRRGFAAEDLLRRMGVPREAQDSLQWPVPIGKFGAALRHAARRMGDELVGMWEKPVPLGTFACVTQQMLHCASLGEALGLGLRLYRLVAPGFPLRLRIVQGMAHLEVRLPAARADVAFEAASVYWVLCLARWLANRPIPVRRAWMSSAAQDLRYREQQPFFEVPACSTVSGTAIVFNASQLSRPVILIPGKTVLLEMLYPSAIWPPWLMLMLLMKR